MIVMAMASFLSVLLSCALVRVVRVVANLHVWLLLAQLHTTTTTTTTNEETYEACSIAWMLAVCWRP